MDEQQTSKEVEAAAEEKPSRAVILLKNGMQLNQVPLEEITALGVTVRASITMRPRNPREKAREIVTSRLIPWGAILMLDLLPNEDNEVLA